ncbi:hypothetical protein [Kineococcus terrestris]|uniref:hypothetical protein n=1 Tax=Kineococcus terrestris TaxID=2044856 RepID=UPI0034DB3182
MVRGQLAEPRLEVSRSSRAPAPRGLAALRRTSAVLAVVLTGLLGVHAAQALTGPPADGAEPSPTPLPRVTTDSDALARLEALRADGLRRHAPEGQWVAQLSAKSVGLTDPEQTAANGSNTFYATDILAQVQDLAAGVASGEVFVLRSTDLREELRDPRGEAYWNTFAAGSFADAAAVRRWCDEVFVAVDGPERGHVCFAKQLHPAGG